MCAMTFRLQAYHVICMGLDEKTDPSAILLPKLARLALVVSPQSRDARLYSEEGSGSMPSMHLYRVVSTQTTATVFGHSAVQGGKLIATYEPVSHPQLSVGCQIQMHVNRHWTRRVGPGHARLVSPSFWVVSLVSRTRLLLLELEMVEPHDKASRQVMLSIPVLAYLCWY